MAPKLQSHPIRTAPAAVYYFAELFMLWSTFQAGVMLVQNRYQKRRMYTRIALGKNSAMDVVSGESSGSAGQLLLLYPLLFSECWILGVQCNCGSSVVRRAGLVGLHACAAARLQCCAAH
jgi:hypothetical protein